MMNIDLDSQNIQFSKGYQKESWMRLAFNELAIKIFSLSFEAWYQAGYWNEKYIPYTLFKDGKAISNVSVNIIDFELTHTKLKTIQLGTVMTHPAYRNQQLNRFLMERVLTEWQDKVDFIYLYANPNVLQFYPKFGFKTATEYTYFRLIDDPSSDALPYEKLDMKKQEDRNLLYQHIKKAKPLSKIAMQVNNDLVMFYAISVLKDNIYYFPNHEAIAIATLEDSTLTLWDIFCLKNIALDSIIASLAPKDIKEVSFGFTPLDCDACQKKPLAGEDILFIRSRKNTLFETNSLMFPLLSHA